MEPPARVGELQLSAPRKLHQEKQSTVQQRKEEGSREGRQTRAVGGGVAWGSRHS